MMRKLLVIPVLAVLGAAGLAAQEPAPPPPPAPPHAPAVPHPPAPPEGFALEMHRGGSFLGIGVQDIDADLAKELKLSEVRGVEVTRVEEDSPASKAGLKKGDVVLEYNGERVEGTQQFVRLVRETPVGRQVKLVISRDGATQTLTATIGERKPREFVIQRRFGTNPDWQRKLEQLREGMGGMRLHLPDLPEPFMAMRSGMLGAEVETLTPQLAEFFGVKQGVLVRSVVKDSAAEKAGLKAGDVIVKVDGTDVGEPSDITRRIRRMEKKTFPLSIVRNHQEMTLNVTIEPRSHREMGPRPVTTPRPQAFQFRTDDEETSPIL
jgi:serine protease Do